MRIVPLSSRYGPYSECSHVRRYRWDILQRELCPNPCREDGVSTQSSRDLGIICPLRVLWDVPDVCDDLYRKSVQSPFQMDSTPQVKDDSKSENVSDRLVLDYQNLVPLRPSLYQTGLMLYLDILGIRDYLHRSTDSLRRSTPLRIVPAFYSCSPDSFSRPCIVLR